MSKLTEFFLASTHAAVQLETIEISHPDMLTTWRLCRNNRENLTVTLENSTNAIFEYSPMKISQSGTRDDLDYGLRIAFGDLGEIIPDQLDAIEAADGMQVLPTVKYRVYDSTDLTEPLLGPFNLQAKQIIFNGTGATIEAVAPRLNLSRTGELYRVDRFPMLRGLL